MKKSKTLWLKKPITIRATIIGGLFMLLAAFVTMIGNYILSKYQISENEYPFRVSYYTLGGLTMDYLFEKKISKDWDKLLGGNPFIVQNDTYQELKKIMKEYSFSPMYGIYDVMDITRISNSGDTIIQYLDVYDLQKSWVYNKQFLLGTGQYDDGFINYPGFYLTKEPAQKMLLKLRNDLHLSTMLVLNINENFSLDTIDMGKNFVEFQKFADSVDLDYLSNLHHIENSIYLSDLSKTQKDKYRTDFDLYKYVTKQNFPKDFLPIVIKDDFEYECGGGRGLLVEAFRRILQLQVIVIENTSSVPIRLGNASIKFNRNKELRALREENHQLSQIDQENVVIFPQQILKPNESLLLPLKMSFYMDNPTSEEDDFDEIKNANDIKRLIKTLETISKSEESIHIKFTMDNGIKESSKFKIKEIIELLKNSANVFKNIEKKYYYGPSSEFCSLEVNDKVYPIRNFNPNELIIYNGFAIGSCPYVYTFDKNKGWSLENHILYGVDSPIEEKKEKIQLKQFDGNILIKEIESETSYINYLSIEIISENGNVYTFRPDDSRLIHDDQKYLIMNKGDSLVVHFTDSPPKGIYNLISKGYYIVNSKYNRYTIQ